MEIIKKIIESDTRKIKFILKDELGNIATGQSYNEALGYLMVRRVISKKRKR